MRNSFLVLTSLLICFSSFAVIPKKFDDLDDKIKKSLKSDEFVVLEKEIEDAPWPQYTVITTIDIPAKDAISIFSAYHHQQKFVPGIIFSRPVKHVTPTDVHVSFEMHSPWPVPNSRYTTGNQIVDLKDGRFQVKWYFVKSNLTSDNKGQITFIPTSESSTLIHYQTFIRPKSIFASLVESKVRGDLVKTIGSIKKHLTKVAKEMPGELKEYRDLFDRSISGEKIYNEMIKKNLLKK